MSDRPGLDTAELLAHTGWVRTLAARLALDPQHVDDVVQDVWHAALRKPPRTRVALGAWLTGVVRNVTAMGRRSEARRQQREIRAARPAATRSTAELAERAELQARLTARVNDLPEAYRDVVLLRFFEDLPPRKIAEHLGIPVNTVGSRLTRALARLREGLDSEYGDRRSWGLIFLPLVRPSDAAAAGAAATATEAAEAAHATSSSAAASADVSGTLASGSTSGMKPLLAAGVVAVVGVGAWLVFDDQGVGDPDRKEVVHQQAPARKPPAERTLIADQSATKQPPAPGARFLGRILDSSGKPVRSEPVAMFRLAPDLLAGATVDYSPQRMAPAELAVGRTRTDREGRFVIEGRWPESLFVVTWGRTLRYVTATPQPGQPVDLGDLVLRATTGVVGRIVDSRGFGVAGARVRAVNLTPAMLADYPLWQFLDAQRLIYKRRPDTPTEVADFWHRLLALPEALDDTAMLPRPAWLDGIADLWPFVEVETQADGRFELHGLRGKAKKTTLVVTKGGHVTIVDEVAVDMQRILDVGTLELPAAPFARGRVFGTDGMPLQNAEVCVAPVSPNSSPVHFALPTVHTDSDGSFKVLGVTTDRIYLAVRVDPSNPWVVREYGARGFITMRLPPRHHVAFRLVSRKHKPVGKPEVDLVPGHRTLQHVRHGLIEALVPGKRPRLREDGRWQIDEVLPGRYTLVVRTPAHATHAIHLSVEHSQEHVFYLDPIKKVTVQVHDQNLEPIKGAQVYAQILRPGGPLAGITLACGNTDTKGTVTIDRLVGESIAITAVHPVHGIAHRAAELADGTEWHLRLALPGRIAGQLTDTDEPGKWTVQMRPVDAHRALPAAFAFAAPDETSRFLHTPLPEGHYEVLAIRGLQGSYPKEDLVSRLLHDGSQTSGVVVNTVVAALVHLDTQIKQAADAAEPEPAATGPADPAPPTLKGTVQLSDGRPAAGVTLEFRQVASTGRVSSDARTARTDKQGRFHVRNLDDGKYDVVGRGPGPSRCRFDVVVRDGKTAPITVRMTDGVFVDGRLTKPGKLRAIQFIRQDASGNWLDDEGRVLKLKDASKLTPPNVRLDASGRFRNDIVLRAGRYQVTPVGTGVAKARGYYVYIEIGDTDRQDLVIPQLIYWRVSFPPIPRARPEPGKGQQPEKDRKRRQRR
ncbi:MAG: sigma-70 family RNA polymerase sigma factor [Planctomycetota bacterium]